MTQHTKVLIFAPEITPRVEYTFEFIFRNILGAELIFTTKLDEFLQYEHTRINYSQTSHSSGLFLKAHSLLFEKNITIQDTTEFEYIDSRLFFPTSNDSFLPFDPFACTFYLLTRYEEYLSESTDKLSLIHISEPTRLGMISYA